MACRFKSMQTIILDYQCDRVSSTVIKFRNHTAAFQHSLPFLTTDGEKIILLYFLFIYFSSQCQKCLQISILWTETGSLTILFNSMTFKIIYGNSLFQLFGSARNLHLFLIDDLDFFHILGNKIDYFCSK